VQAVAISARDAAPEVHDLPDPTPGPDEVLIRSEAASVNGFDVAVAAGYVWDALPHEFPVVLGRDVAGVVEAVGEDVQGVQVGELVVTVIPGVGLGPVGTFAKRFVAPADLVARVPDQVTPTQAAALGLAAVTALDAVDALDIDTTDIVLVSGATGGVGAFAVQLAAARGARVIATARPGDGEALVRRLGAGAVVDHTGDLKAQVRAIAPDGVTKILHAAGDPAALGKLLLPDGVLLSTAGATKETVGRDDVTVSGMLADPTAEKLADLMDAVVRGELTVPVAQTYPFDDVADALATFGSGKLGKIVVEVA